MSEASLSDDVCENAANKLAYKLNYQFSSSVAEKKKKIIF